jgi:ribose-phosphate pyrophosphokinase
MVVIGDVQDRDIVLIDDICDTGGTLAKSAGLLKEKGARSVRAFCTHPVLSGKAYENIENSELEELVVCDTIPVKHLGALENKSINSLFLRSRMANKNG